MEDPIYLKDWIPVVFSIVICLSVVLTMITGFIIFNTLSDFSLAAKFRGIPEWKVNKWSLFAPSIFLAVLTLGSYWLTFFFGGIYNEAQEEMYHKYAYIVEFDVPNAHTFKFCTNKEPVIQDGFLLWTFHDGTEVKTSCFKIRKNKIEKK